ncbi:MAG: MlaD family protein [bacterium]|nr:MlaD family protein [bacterium]
MKISRELIVGIVTLVAIALLVMGVNFLKGNSFLGGDQVYYAYFPTSGGVTPATSVYVNGVDVGKVLDVEYMPNQTDTLKRVRIKFNITTEGLKIVKGSKVEAGGIDLLSKGLIIHMNNDISQGYVKPGSRLPGFVSSDVTTQIKQYADPLTQKVEGALVSIDKMVNDISAFWDSTASSELQGSMKELRVSIRKIGNAVDQVEGLLVDERVRLSRIMGNVEAITLNLKKSNDTVKAIVGNVKGITDELVTADYKGTIESAKNTLDGVNRVLDAALDGDGTIGKLISDDSLYMELIQTNQELQNLVEDLQKHPERYIHFSVLGAKSKRQFTEAEEKKIRKEVIDN